MLRGGVSDYCPANIVSLCEGLTARAAKSTSVELLFCNSTTTVENPAALAAADVVFVAVGGTLGHEAQDRVNISLPSDQQGLIAEVVQAVGASKVVLVVVNGNPVALDGYAGVIPTIVEAMEGGQAGGTGLASVLFGDVSPSGILPFTIYPDSFVTKVSMSDMSMRANSTTGNPGRTVNLAHNVVFVVRHLLLV